MPEDLYSLQTPSLVLDVDRVRNNADRMLARASELGVRLRPHIKTHKCIEVARVAIGADSGPITVSTLAEAEAFAEHGFRDITYAVPIEPGRFDRVFQLIQKGVDIKVITDDADTVDALAAAARSAGSSVGVFLEVDCGDHRSGADPTSENAINTARKIAEADSLTFCGILTHGGHSYNVPSVAEIKTIAAQERDVMLGFAAKLRSLGVLVPTISVGSTPTMMYVDHLDGIDEMRPGNYIFFDVFQATLGSCSLDDCALTVLAAVVYRSIEKKKIIIDAGAIAMSKDRGPVDRDPSCGYGRVLDLEGNGLGLHLDAMSQEHGTIYVADDSLLEKLPVGSRVRIAVNHSCLTAAQHRHYNVLEGGRIVDRWKIHTGW